MSNEKYFIILGANEIELEESVNNEVRVLATVLELDIPSKNGRLYQFGEGETIAKSLEGKPVYYGTNWLGKHDNPLVMRESKNEPVGIVEKCWVAGNKIKAKIKIYGESLANKIRGGAKFLFSVGGVAKNFIKKRIGDRNVDVLEGAKCNHLQIIDGSTPVGFPSAKLEKILNVNETQETCLYLEIGETENKPENGVDAEFNRLSEGMIRSGATWQTCNFCGETVPRYPSGNTVCLKCSKVMGWRSSDIQEEKVKPVSEEASEPAENELVNVLHELVLEQEKAEEGYFEDEVELVEESKEQFEYDDDE